MTTTTGKTAAKAGQVTKVTVMGKAVAQASARRKQTRPVKPDHISQEAWDSVDSPPLTKEQLARATTKMPDFLARQLAKRAPRGPQKAPTKVSVTIRLDRDIVDGYKAGGEGWQTRLNDDLRALRQRVPA